MGVFYMKQCIENPNELKWEEFWAERLKNKKDKDWDKAAPGFFKRTKKDDYNNALFDMLILDKDDTVATAIAEQLLPLYLDKTLKALDALAQLVKSQEAWSQLRDLTVFCAERNR